MQCVPDGALGKAGVLKRCPPLDDADDRLGIRLEELMRCGCELEKVVVFRGKAELVWILGAVRLHSGKISHTDSLK